MSATRGGSGHPDESTTAAYIDGALAGAERDRFETHLAACEPCRAGVVLLKSHPAGAVESHAASGGETVPSEFLERANAAGAAPPARRARATVRWVAAAALVVAAAGITVVELRRIGPERTFSDRNATYRGEETEAFGMVTPGSGSIVPAGHLIFTWQAVAGADRYQLDVLASTGERILSLEVGADRLSARWPPERPAPAPGPLMWRLRAQALDRVLAETRPIPFEVR